jgi:pimeloyl-ACP methyl ester carboxylesterase
MILTVKALFVAAIAVLVAASVWFVIAFVWGRGSTPPIRDDAGREVAGSVAVLERVRLGGDEQYVLIRGHDAANPVLLFLHGGPGMPAMYLAHAFQRELERDFTVVHWGRLGAGKSYGAGASRATFSVRRTLDDTYELSEWLIGRFGPDRIVLVGHSWGSYLGMLAIRERPDLFDAFVGTGQVASDRLREREVQRAYLYDRANEAGDQDLLERLQKGARVDEDDLFRHGAQLRGVTSHWALVRIGFKAPEYTLLDALNVPRGAAAVGARMDYDVVTGPLDETVLSVEVPVHFFLGRHDFNTPSVLAAEYWEKLAAPCKRLVWFEDSAHFPFLEEPERFREEMLKAVAAETCA